MSMIPGYVRTFLRGKNLAFMSTLKTDGSPQITPVWINATANHVLVNTALGRLLERNTRRDPRVAITIVEQVNPYNVVTIQGRVVGQISGLKAVKHSDRLAKKYLGLDRYPGQLPGGGRVVLKIKCEQFSGPDINTKISHNSNGHAAEFVRDLIHQAGFEIRDGQTHFFNKDYDASILSARIASMCLVRALFLNKGDFFLKDRHLAVKLRRSKEFQRVNGSFRLVNGIQDADRTKAKRVLFEAIRLHDIVETETGSNAQSLNQ